ncbi:hypothetical protein ACMHYB_28835 [Sorangium sp. So ce1128]
MATQVQYDPQIVQKFASDLYRQANGIIVTHTVIGALLGLTFGLAPGILAREGSVAVIGALAVGLLGCALGLSTGRQRAFALKLQAQTALCQLQIEANTRAAAQYSRA